MGRTTIRWGMALGAWLACGSAGALSPSELFQKVSPSVWAVRALDADERPIHYGSAVVVGPGRLVTNCHVLAKAKAIQLRQGNAIFEATVEHADAQRDLCMLAAKDFSAPAVTTARFAELAVGQRVFAVGNPERMAATLTDGLLSGLKNEDGAPSLQTTAPLAPGLSGGGLFDEAGRLIGITTVGDRSRAGAAPSLQLAAPAEWIEEIAARAQLAGVKQAAQSPVQSSAAPGLPAVGARWNYSFRDRQYRGNERRFTIRVAEAGAKRLREAFAAGDGEERTLEVDPEAIHFTARPLTSDYSVIELAPYYFSSEKAAPSASTRPARYPGPNPWDIGPLRMRSEDITVPAGTFKATRVDVTGTIRGGGALQYYVTSANTVGRFTYTAWYAPAVNRYVMIRNQTWNLRGVRISDEVTQLLEYLPK